MSSDLKKYIYFYKPEGLNLKGKRFWNRYADKEVISISDSDFLDKMQYIHFNDYKFFLSFSENLRKFRKFYKVFSRLSNYSISALEDDFDKLSYEWQTLFLNIIENFSDVNARVDKLENKIDDIQIEVSNLEC